MNGYKKIFKSQKFRFKILKILRFVPDKLMISMQYRIKLGRKINFNNPKRYTEKLQWYKLYYRTEKMSVCADKYRVREYLEEKGLSDIACTLYGCYENPQEIDFNKLPKKFVLKTTNGSSTNILCKDKEILDIAETKKKLDEWIKCPFYELGREWAYKNVKPRIIAEEFLEDNENSFVGINDYKFICFNGKVHYVVFDCDRFKDHKRAIYDREWNYINVSTDCGKVEDIIPIPEGFLKMRDIAEQLAEDFPCVRVDLYWVNKKVYFGEMTFYPWTGYVQFDPDKFDFELGDKFILPEKVI